MKIMAEYVNVVELSECLGKLSGHKAPEGAGREVQCRSISTARTEYPPRFES